MIRRIAPFIKNLSPALSSTGDAASVLQTSGSTRAGVRLDWIDDRDEIFGPHHLSDGTLRAIALITALGQPVSRLPLFISIDEPELGLHPAALAMVCGLVQSVASRSQVMLSTQSPEVLDHFPAESVVVVERHEGASVFNRLEPQRLAAWLEDYSLSELYDKNLLGGRP
jgi:predicted ATPase